MPQKVIILIGPPGSGKDTQAEFLAKEISLVNVKTSALIENEFKNGHPDDPELKIEKEKWASGELNGTAFVERLISTEVKKLHEQNKGIVFSGSPREEPETRTLMPLIESLYGRENIFIFNIQLSAEESLKRNSHRRICQANRHPIPNFSEYQNITTCPEDGSPIIVRPLDSPETIKTRYQVYLKKTEPVFALLNEMGYKIHDINGEQSIADVHRDILNSLHDS